MKLFLLKDVAGLGMANEIVDVNDGYARNRLLPANIGMEVTKDNAAFFEKRKITLKNREEKVATETSMRAERIKAMKLEIKHKAHDNGKLYGSVGQSEIAELFKQKGESISKNQVILNKAIKATGSYDVTIKLSSRLQPTVTLQVLAE